MKLNSGLVTPRLCERQPNILDHPRTLNSGKIFRRRPTLLAKGPLLAKSQLFDFLIGHY